MKTADLFFYSIVIFLLVIFASCRQTEVYEKNVTIPGYAWKSDFVVQGDLNISDTNSYYNVFLVLRHTDAYRYNNIWVDAAIFQAGDSILFGKKSVTLGNDQTGWEGSGMDDIWDVRKKINDLPLQFRKMGNYHFTLKHIMTDDPLSSVMSAGIRIEKADN